MQVKHAEFSIEDMKLRSDEFVVVKVLKPTKREFFRDLGVGDVVAVDMQMYLPAKSCIGKPYATEMQIRNVRTEAVYNSTLTVIAQALSQLKLKIWFRR